MVIVSTLSYHFGFMYEIDTLFEHMQSHRTSNNKISKKVLFPPNIIHLLDSAEPDIRFVV